MAIIEGAKVVGMRASFPGASSAQNPAQPSAAAAEKQIEISRPVPARFDSSAATPSIGNKSDLRLEVKAATPQIPVSPTSLAPEKPQTSFIPKSAEEAHKEFGDYLAHRGASINPFGRRVAIDNDPGSLAAAAESYFTVSN